LISKYIPDKYIFSSVRKNIEVYIGTTRMYKTQLVIYIRGLYYNIS